MNIPEPISKSLGKHKWIPVLIFGIFLGTSFMVFIQNERMELLKSQIDEYRERLKIPKPNEGPYSRYTYKELKDRALKLSSEIERLCERNPLLSIDTYYKETIEQFREQPINSERKSPFVPGSLIYIDEPKYEEAFSRLSPIITKKDIGRTMGDLVNEMITRINNSIKPELDLYKNKYRDDVIDLKNEMLSRMPPRAWRHYTGHVELENPGQYLIGVPLQLREISEEF